MYSDDVLELGDYLAVLARRKWLVVAVTVLTVAAALGFSFAQTPVYQATVDVAVEPFRESEDASLQEIILGDVTVNTEQRVMTSRAVTERVIGELELEVAPGDLLEEVNVSVISETRVLRLKVSDTSADQAAEIANGYAKAYLGFRRDQAVDSLVAAQQTLTERQDSLRQQLDDVESQLDGLDESATTERDALASERDALLSQLNQVATQSSQAQADAQLVKGGGQILNPAESPESPVSPKPIRTGILALVLGLMLGVGVAFLRDHLDDMIRDEDDAKRAAGDHPILGRIPSGDKDQERVVTLVEPGAPQAEAYRGLSAAVRFLLAAQRGTGFGDDAPEDGQATGGQSILITSPDPGDGKTSIAANLAVAAARAGMRVVLVGADMRRPKIHRLFGMPSGAGLSDVIVAAVPIREALVDVGVDNLWVLPAGTSPPNPAELLASPRMRALGRFLVEGADLVVVDAPPVLAVADTLELAPYADSTLVVVRANQSRRRNLQHTLERLDGVGATVSGLVVNDLDEKSAAYTYYTQSYGRNDDPEALTQRPGKAATPAARSSSFGAMPAGNGHGPGSIDDLQDPSQLFPVGRDGG